MKIVSGIIGSTEEFEYKGYTISIMQRSSGKYAFTVKTKKDKTVASGTTKTKEGAEFKAKTQIDSM